MKDAWIFLGVLAAALGAWWWWHRSGRGSPMAWLDPPTGNAGPYSYVPPLPPNANPSAGGNWRDPVTDAAGAAARLSAQQYCKQQGGKDFDCKLAGEAAGVAGKYVTKGALYVGGKAVSGAKAVGSGAKSLAKKIIPGW